MVNQARIVKVRKQSGSGGGGKRLCKYQSKNQAARSWGEEHLERYVCMCMQLQGPGNIKLMSTVLFAS